jgi:hypothetical protein
MKLLDELKALKRIAEVSLYSAFGVTALFITFSVITGSVSLLTYFIWAAAAILVKIFALVSIRVMLKENQFLLGFIFSFYPWAGSSHPSPGLPISCARSPSPYPSSGPCC